MVPPGTDDYHRVARNLANAWEDKYEQTYKSEDLTEAISHYRTALTSYPLDHPLRPSCLTDLAVVLRLHFEWCSDLNDAQEAAMLCQGSLDLLDKEHPERMRALMNLANIYHARFLQTSDSEYLEKAISQYREVLPLYPHKSKDNLLQNLALSLMNRFHNFGRMDCLEEAISIYRAALRLCPWGHPRRQLSLCGLAHAMHARYLWTHTIEDLKESIGPERENLALTLPGHPMRPQMLYNLSIGLHTQYTWTGDMGYVEEGIEYLHETSKSINSGHPLSRRILYLLATNLSDRFRHRGADKDIADAIEHYRTSISLMPEGH
jgi:tetratricopeptide (TPR) repeat protein